MYNLSTELSQVSLQPGYSPAGWYSRATRVPADSPYEIVHADLAFAVTINCMVKSHGLLAAFFKPNTAINANGHIFTLQQDDWNGLVQLAEATTSLPKSGERNVWVFKRFISCPSTEYIYVATPSGLHATTISAWTNKKSELVHPVGDIKHLPEDLRLLVEYAYEGFKDYGGYEDRNISVEEQVMSLLNPDYSGF